MKDKVELAFEREGITLPLDAILPTRQARPSGKDKASRYLSIVASIREVGIIEPLIVFRQSGQPARYLLLDGHWRLHALRELGVPEAFCLIAKDDEAFTFNHRISRLAPIQENMMILRALENGVSEERMARALKFDIAKIRASRDLLTGIHPDAVDLLRDKHVTAGALRLFKKVKPMRQVEMAGLMVSMNNFTAGYAKALLAGTRRAHLVRPEEPKRTPGVKAEDIARMEDEMSNVERDFKAVESSYGENVLNLTVAGRYVESLLGNARVTRYLTRHHRELLTELRTAVGEGRPVTE